MFTTAGFGRPRGESAQGADKLRQGVPDRSAGPRVIRVRLSVLNTGLAVDGQGDRGHHLDGGLVEVGRGDEGGLGQVADPGQPREHFGRLLQLSGVFRVCRQAAVTQGVRPVLVVRLVVLLASPVRRGQVVRVGPLGVCEGNALLVAEQLPLQAVVLGL